ncbi:hypothetical protein [Candidatus Tisiphia endosymbiont of Sialis lutaria]|uniref:hypothetical protein n=1 Tax=Candidatus Tisiphia endosymbiont of Sialis lutaria TaxID=2029164 RepID=UPI00312CAE7C
MFFVYYTSLILISQQSHQPTELREYFTFLLKKIKIICFDEKDSGRPISVGAAKTYKTNFFPKSYPSIEVKIKLSLSLKSKIH